MSGQVGGIDQSEKNPELDQITFKDGICSTSIHPK